MIDYEKKKCEYEVNNFCTAFACYSKETCTAKDDKGKPLYTDFENRDQIKAYQ